MEQKEKKYKFVHIMPMGNSSFCINFINFINDNVGEEHLFIIISRNRIDSLANYDNVIYEPRLSIRLLYKYSKEGIAIIMHSLPFSALSCLLIRKHVLEHITWWVWGHDLYRIHNVKYNSSSSKFKYYLYKLKKIVNVFYVPFASFLWHLVLRLRLKFLKSIVVSCRSDEESLRVIIGERIKIFRSGYTQGYYIDDLDKIPTGTSSGVVNILLGHSSFEFLQHKKYLEKLLAYREENIRIIIPLSYGNMEYANEISRYARLLYGNKVLILSESLDFMSYAKMIKGIDIAIFDFNHQSALGNIVLLFLFGKKVYLSSNGILYRGYTADGISVYDCSEVGKVPFNVFKENSKSTSAAINYARSAFDKLKIEANYKSIFNYIHE